MKQKDRAKRVSLASLTSLRTKLILPFCALALAVSAACGLAAWQYLTHDAAQSAFAEAHSATQTAAKASAEITRGAARIASKIVVAVDLPSADRVAIDAALAAALASDPGALQVSYASPTGDARIRRNAINVPNFPSLSERVTNAALTSGWIGLSANGTVASSEDVTTHFILRQALSGQDGRTVGSLDLVYPATALSAGLSSQSVASAALVSDVGTRFSLIGTPSTDRANAMTAAMGLRSGWAFEVQPRQTDPKAAGFLYAKTALAALLPFLIALGLVALPLFRALADIEDLAKASERFRLGAALDSLPLKRPDEIGRVARAMAAMSSQATAIVGVEKAKSELGDVVSSAQKDALSAQRAVLARTKDQVRQLAAVVEAAYEGIAILDRKFRIEYANPAFANEFRMPSGTLKGLRISDLFHPEAKQSIDQFEPVLDLGIVVRETVRCKRADSVELYAELTASPVRDESGAITGVVIVERDMTHAVMSSELMTKQLLIDPLTEVWRRSALVTDMERRAGRPDRPTFSVLFIDLDGFKQINDRFGHEAGDNVLRSVGSVLRSQIRENDVAGRYGGDEFIIVVDDDAKESNARRIAQRVVAAIPTVTGLRYPDIRFAASIGIACFPRDADSIADVVRCADHAMYAAKRSGGGRMQSWAEVKSKPSWNSAPPSAEVLTLRRRG